MKRTLAKIVLTAFMCGLVAETAYTLYTGSASIDTAIELALCWCVVLAIAMVTAWKAIDGTLVRTVVHTVVVHDEPEDEAEDEEEPEPEPEPEPEEDEEPEPEPEPEPESTDERSEF